MYRKTTYIIFVFLFVVSCGAMKDVKRGITNEKVKSTDEFLVQKKDPLILPPDYENLPNPSESASVIDEVSNFEKSLGSSIEDVTDTSNTSGSAEESILRKIRSK